MKILKIPFAVAIVFVLLTNNVSAATIGLVSDIHAGSQDASRMAGVTINPIMGIENLKQCVAEMNDKKVDAIIATGDLTNKGQAAYFSQLRDIAGVIWVKGNHDGKHFSSLSSSTYTVDFKEFRVIVLDSNTKNKNGEGWLSKKQLKWLKTQQITDKNIVIAMHHPVFKRGGKHKHKFNQKKYGKFLKTLTPNVKLVVSGHWHNYHKFNKNGISFIVVPAMKTNDYIIVEL